MFSERRIPIADSWHGRALRQVAVEAYERQIFSACIRGMCKSAVAKNPLKA